MKSLVIKGSLRETVGKKGAKASRNIGQVPCVLYGGKEQVHFTADEAEFRKLIYSADAYLVKISINQTEYSAVLKEAQFHPVTDNLLHVDFVEISASQPVEIEIPINFEGTASGVALKGGILAKTMRKLKVKGLIDNIPEVITIDISNLDLNHSIKIGDLKQDNLTFVDNPKKVIVAVRTARTVEETTTAVAAEGTEAAPVAGAAAPAAGAAPAAKPGDAKAEPKKDAK